MKRSPSPGSAGTSGRTACGMPGDDSDRGHWQAEPDSATFAVTTKSSGTVRCDWQTHSSRQLGSQNLPGRVQLELEVTGSPPGRRTRDRDLEPSRVTFNEVT